MDDSCKPKERVNVKEYEKDMKHKNKWKLIKFILCIFVITLGVGIILGVFAYYLLMCLNYFHILSTSNNGYYIDSSSSILGSIIGVVSSFISSHMSIHNDMKHNRYNFLIDLLEVAYKVKEDSLELDNNFKNKKYDDVRLLMTKLTIEGSELRKNIFRLTNIDNSSYIVYPAKSYKFELYGIKTGLNNIDSILKNPQSIQNLLSTINKFVLSSVSLYTAIKGLTNVYK